MTLRDMAGGAPGVNTALRTLIHAAKGRLRRAR